MNCKEIQGNFDERLDNRLDAAHTAAFEAHVAACPACAAEWRAYAGAWATVGQHAATEPSVGFAERTLRRLDERLTERPSVWLAPLWRWALAAGLVVTLSAGGWFGWRQTHQSSAKPDPQVEAYIVTQQDRLEDFDVVASLHLLNGDNSHENTNIN